jgi:uncharacterized protein
MASTWRWLVMADPVHGMMQFDRKDPIHRLVLEAVNSRAFQRLRRIRQMGLAEFVFPGAVHTRFNHSLGATYLMSQALLHFRHEKAARELLQAHAPNTGISYECLLMLGILLHDVGHGPLSHTLEDVLGLEHQGLSHDHYWFYRILQDDPDLRKVWQEAGFTQMPEALRDFMGLGESPKHFLAMLVSSQLDMDRVDYLLRDSHFLGVRYGFIESDRLIHSLEIHHKTPQGQPVVTIREEALPAVEHYLFGRHQAYKMALHSLDKAAETLLKWTLHRFIWAKRQGIATGNDANDLFLLATDGSQLETHRYLRMDDAYLWEAIHSWSEDAEDPLLKTLANRLMQHELPRFLDLLQFRDPITEAMLEAAKADLSDYYRRRGLQLDFGYGESLVRPKPLYMPQSQREPIWVATRDKGVVPLPEVSWLAQSYVPDKGHKHLIFLWDKEATQFFRQRLLAYQTALG